MDPASAEVRTARVDDLSFIRLMLDEAANRPGDTWPPIEEFVNEARTRRFWDGFPSRGDLGRIAEIQSLPVGAAWIRHFSGPDLSPIDDPAVPVLAIGIDRGHRGRGVGSLLMDALLADAREAGITEIALTTGLFNEPALRLYRRCGFVEVLRRDDSVKMTVTLR